MFSFADSQNPLKRKYTCYDARNASQSKYLIYTDLSIPESLCIQFIEYLDMYTIQYTLKSRVQQYAYQPLWPSMRSWDPGILLGARHTCKGATGMPGTHGMQGSMEMALGYPHDRHICRGAMRMPGIQEASMGLLHLLVHLFVRLYIDLLDS